MSSILDTIVQLTIVVTSAVLSRPGFGTPLALVSKVPAGWGPAKVRTFGKLSELVDAGFAATDAAYVLASRIKAQIPCPPTFKLAKRATAPVQTLHLQCLSAVTGDVYHVDVGINGAPTTSIDYTVPGASTTTTVATAIAALIAAVSGLAATSTTDTITVTPAVSGNLVHLLNWAEKGKKHFDLEDITADPGISTEFAAVLTEDTDWYGALLDSNSKAEIAAAATWVEANGKLFGYATSDTAATNSGSTTDALAAAKTSAYKRSFGLYNGNDILGYSAAAWMAVGFAFDPGKITWAFKTLAGVPADDLTAGETSAIEGKNGNHYQATSGKNITFPGKRSDGDYIDITHFLDWLNAEMQLQVFATISGQPKVPFTKGGIGQVEATIRGVLRAGVRAGGLVDDDQLTVTMPAVEDIDPTTRADRLLPDISFTARLAGAIHKTKIDGTVSA